MKLSKKSRYGITALIDLSINSKSGHVSLSSIAERNDISPQYLEQVFAGLRRYGIVTVSYTHLDVYKRQILNNIFSLCKSSF